MMSEGWVISWSREISKRLAHGNIRQLRQAELMRHLPAILSFHDHAHGFRAMARADPYYI